MGTTRAMQVCWVILGLLLLRGHNSQPIASQTTQGLFSSLSLTTVPISPITGNESSSESGSPRLLPSTSAPEVPYKASQGPLVSSKHVTLRSSTLDGHFPFLLGLTQSQPQKQTSELVAGTGAPNSNGSSSSSSSSSTRGETSQNATPSSITMSLRTREDLAILPSPTSETVLTVAAFGVISFIVILVVVVIILVGVVSLRFKCRKNKESEDPQKPGSSGISESCSTANGEKDSITLISVKNINTNNSKGCPSAEKVL
ncbi:endothelial cell-specific chemotaxis regulator isoform X2 [Castor canadensis]|uniref:Endothelial cell-specific chemotaxis regulator isoform X2 n=1 Tax=Castor canadensis TaxID=51338 RepID=A0AC58MUF7_CASCN